MNATNGLCTRMDLGREESPLLVWQSKQVPHGFDSVLERGALVEQACLLEVDGTGGALRRGEVPATTRWLGRGVDGSTR